MFKDDYKAQMDKITIGDEKKSEILKQLNESSPPTVTRLEKKEKMLKTRNIWRIGFAAAAAVAVTLSVIFVPDWHRAPIAEPSVNTVTKAESYSEIYDKIQSITQQRVQAREKSAGDFISSFFGAKGTASAADEYADEYAEYEYSSETTATAGEKNGTMKGGYGDITDTGNSAKSDGSDFSTTNTQVDGVEEADIVRTDGRYIYALRNGKIYIIRAGAGVPEKVAVIDLEIGDNANCTDFYLSDGKITAVTEEYGTTAFKGKIAAYVDYVGENGRTTARFYDVSDPTAPEKIAEISQSGATVSSRMIGDRLYLVSEYYVSSETDKNKPETFVPSVSCNDKTAPVSAESVCIYSAEKYDPVYTVVGIYDSSNGNLLDTQSLLGGSSEIYCSRNSLLTAVTDYSSVNSKTFVSRFSLSKDTVKYETSAEINGTLLNQFSMDEYNGYFRFVTTVDKTEESTVSGTTSSTYTRIINGTDVSLIILDNALQPVSSLNDLAEGERVYSVRFMGNTAYFVTFRETDPLFSVDLSDPKKPTVLGKLKIPGFSNYLFPYGNGKLLGIGMEADEKTGKPECLKLSMFDISDPANVTESDKCLMRDYSYSAALYNHKASLIEPDKNLIGFTAEGKDAAYLLYKYENGEFVNIASFKITLSYAYETRGLFIGNVFYLVEENSVKAYGMDGYTLLGDLTFGEN